MKGNMQTPDLSTVSSALEALEETIVSKLIDRAQFRHNTRVYEPGRSGFAEEEHVSLLDLRLRFQEHMDAEFGRFEVPEERPFNTNLPEPKRNVRVRETGLHLDGYNCINLTPHIKDSYLALVPCICRPGDDGQYGSSVEHDVYALQAVSRRIHFGAMYVAECKYRQHPRKWGALIAQGNVEGLWEALTRKDVERAILARVRDKVARAQSLVNTKVRHTIDPEVVLRYYRNHIIPRTKEGEVLYLLNRR